MWCHTSSFARCTFWQDHVVESSTRMFVVSDMLFVFKKKFRCSLNWLQSPTSAVLQNIECHLSVRMHTQTHGSRISFKLWNVSVRVVKERVDTPTSWRLTTCWPVQNVPLPFVNSDFLCNLSTEVVERNFSIYLEVFRRGTLGSW